MNAGGKGWCGKRKKTRHEMLTWCTVWYDMVRKMKAMGPRRSMPEKEMETTSTHHHYNILPNRGRGGPCTSNYVWGGERQKARKGDEAC